MARGETMGSEELIESILPATARRESGLMNGELQMTVIRDVPSPPIVDGIVSLSTCQAWG